MKNRRYTDNIIWIILAFAGWYILLAEIPVELLSYLFIQIPGKSPELSFILKIYTPIIGSVLFFLLMCALSKKNRFLLGIVKPTKEGRSMSMLGMGILLGFLTNFFCVILALLHGDIKLYFDFSAAQIPVMLFAFISVFFQSTSEELWCRGFLYERLNVHYPLWVAVLVNGVLFGLLHCFNPGVTVLAIADIIICGIAYSLLRWYSGSIWICFGIHTMWNFTQNFLFGLPNSGLVSEASVFHLDAATGISNLIYSYEFGVEGALPAVFIDLLLAVVILILARRDGRLGELLESRESRGEVPAETKSTRQEIVEFNNNQESDREQGI